MGRLAVSLQFRRLLTEIQPRPAEVARAKRHFSGIRTRLKKDFSIARIGIFGSHGKNTAVRYYSDVDILVVHARSDIRFGENTISSSTLLKRVRDSLRVTYPSTEIRRDGQAVAVRFGAGEHSVDIVPAVFAGPGAVSGHPIYAIADGVGGWLPTSPDAQLKRLNEADEKSRAKLKVVIKMIKWWMFAREPWIPLDSTHLEAVLTRTGVSPVQPHPVNLANAFMMLRGRNGSAVRDPLGISGLFSLARTEAQSTRVLQALEYSVDHSARALDAEADGNHDEAVRQWKLVFNGRFPG